LKVFDHAGQSGGKPPHSETLARLPRARSVAKRLEFAGSPALYLSAAQPQRNARGARTALAASIPLCRAALRYVMRETWRVRRC